MPSRLEREAEAALGRLEAASRRRRIRPPAGIDFASNDYLGLRRDPRVLDAARRALLEEGLGAGAARLLRGDHPSHRALEDRFRTLDDAEDALLFPSGFHANLGLLGALLDERWTVVSDRDNHASIVDGCRLAGARVVVVDHADAEAASRAIPDERTVVFTEAVFSMSGDRAPLVALTEICERTGAALVVDRAHALGVVPPEGRPLLHVNPCGKALGGAGAVVTGPRAVVDLLRSRCRTFLFTTATAPAIAAGVLAALEIALAEPWRGERALALARRIDSSAVSPIVIRPCESDAAALAAEEALAGRGYDVRCVRPPSVRRGCLRISVHADRTEDEVDGLVGALKEVS